LERKHETNAAAKPLLKENVRIGHIDPVRAFSAFLEDL